MKKEVIGSSEFPSVSISKKDFHMIRGGFALIGNILDVSIDLPTDLIHGLRLERANDEQIQLIKDTFPRHITLDFALEEMFEKAWTTTTTSSGSESVPDSLPRDQWRYFIATHEGQNGSEYDVAKLMALTSPSIRFVASINTDQPFGRGQWIGGGADLRAVLDVMALARRHEQPKKFTEAALTDLRKMHIERQDMPEGHEWIERALEMFFNMRRLPTYSALTTLGYFSIIEMLLTHKPHDRENADSITHQVTTKIPLISKRLLEPIDYSIFPTDQSSESIWKLLYGYRSSIAHGSHADFISGKFKPLGDAIKVQEFLRDVTRRLVRHSLREPVLISDLKAV